MFLSFYLSLLGTAYVQLGQFDDAWHCIGDAMTAIGTTKESWCKAEVHRTAGGLTLKQSKPDTATAQGYFERALAVARQQEVKSWEPRTAMSMARSTTGSPKGFDTLDRKEAKALLDDLNS
jgi:predicted ATPase